MPLTQVSPGLLDTNAQYYGFKNRIINGAMVIDQRNNGASVTPANTAYTLDRWQCFLSGGGAYTVQQSTVAPSGFVNSLLVTVTTADSSIAAADYYILTHKIEGFNTADLAFGTSTASPVTLSFRVRSSLTGTFSGSIQNSAGTRSYPFTYTISTANTFEYKTITIPGDTAGTWLTNNGSGIVLRLSLGMGSTYSAPANAWVSADEYAANEETTKLISTLGATFYITGVQLEKGSTATSFDYRPYGTELALCQRYFQIASASARAYTSDGYWGLQFVHKVSMRTTPTYIVIAGTGNNTLPGTAQGIIVADTFQTGVQWSGSAGTYYAYGIQAQLNSEL